MTTAPTKFWTLALAGLLGKPGNSKVVHHILSAYDVTGRARNLDQADPKPGYKTFVGYGRLKNGLPFLPSGQLGG